MVFPPGIERNYFFLPGQKWVGRIAFSNGLSLLSRCKEIRANHYFLSQPLAQNTEKPLHCLQQRLGKCYRSEAVTMLNIIWECITITVWKNWMCPERLKDKWSCLLVLEKYIWCSSLWRLVHMQVTFCNSPVTCTCLADACGAPWLRN